MRRRTFDLILTGMGAALTLVLLVAGILLTWGYNFAHGEVTKQLSAEQIFFPPAGSPALADPRIGPFLDKYAGQQLTTGAQAQAYADHFIAVHLTEVAGGKTYSQVSAALQTDPNNAQLQQQAATLFQGETLRGLLLNAYAFDTVATIALYAAIASYVGAALLLILTILGIAHLRSSPGKEEVFAARDNGSAPGAQPA
jgi:hypothetical protein